MDEPVTRNKTFTTTIGFVLFALGLAYIVGQRESFFGSTLQRHDSEIGTNRDAVEYSRGRTDRKVEDVVREEELRRKIDELEAKLRESLLECRIQILEAQ